MSEAGLFIISYCDKVTNTVHSVNTVSVPGGIDHGVHGG